jgi:hypothetical protein
MTECQGIEVVEMNEEVAAECKADIESPDAQDSTCQRTQESGSVGYISAGTAVIAGIFSRTANATVNSKIEQKIRP